VIQYHVLRIAKYTALEAKSTIYLGQYPALSRYVRLKRPILHPLAASSVQFSTTGPIFGPPRHLPSF